MNMVQWIAVIIWTVIIGGVLGLFIRHAGWRATFSILGFVFGILALVMVISGITAMAFGGQWWWQI